MGHEQEQDYTPRLNEENWDYKIYGDIPLSDACQLAVTLASDLGIGLKVWHIIGINSVNWKKEREFDRSSSLILSDRVEPAHFKAGGERISVGLGSYILVLPIINMNNDEDIQLAIFDKTLKSKTIRETDEYLGANGIEVKKIRAHV